VVDHCKEDKGEASSDDEREMMEQDENVCRSKFFAKMGVDESKFLRLRNNHKKPHMKRSPTSSVEKISSAGDTTESEVFCSCKCKCFHFELCIFIL
jgi:hypothetical protein